jgi:hypothetical protein
MMVRFATVSCKVTGGFCVFALVIAAQMAMADQKVIITAGSKIAKSMQLAMATAQMAEKIAAPATEPKHSEMDDVAVAFSAIHRKE